MTPKPGEIRESGGKYQIWVPRIPPPSTPPPKTLRRTVSKTKTFYQGNYTIGTIQSSPIMIYGSGIVREVAIVVDQPISVAPKIDGVDILNGNNSFDNLTTVSQYSSTVNALYDDPRYIITIGKVRFEESFEVVIWPQVTTNVLSVTCTYELCPGVLNGE
jgi:hypothetical protein